MGKLRHNCNKKFFLTERQFDLCKADDKIPLFCATESDRHWQQRPLSAMGKLRAIIAPKTHSLANRARKKRANILRGCFLSLRTCSSGVRLMSIKGPSVFRPSRLGLSFTCQTLHSAAYSLGFKPTVWLWATS